MNGVSLTRLASRNPASRDWVDSNCRITEDWRCVATANDLDGVIVATPPALHAEMTRVAVEAGLAVLVEKPLTLNLEEAQNLLAFAESHRGFVLVDHIHLFNPAWQALKDHVATLGPARKIQAIAGGWGPFRPDTTVLWDWGPHDIALCIDLLGRSPIRIEARRSEARQMGGGAGEIVQLHLGFDDGPSAEITLGNLFQEKRRSFSVEYDEWTLIYDDAVPEKLTRRPTQVDPKLFSGHAEPLPVVMEPPLNRVVRVFADGILKGEHSTSSLSLAVQVVAVLSRAQEALDRDSR